MIQEPRIGMLIMIWLSALVFTAVGWQTDIPQPWSWLRFVVRGMAVIFCIIALLLTLDAMWGRAISRMQSSNIARTSHLVTLSKSLRGLSPRQTEIVSRFDPLSVEGILGSDGIVVWNIRGSRFPIPLGFAQDYLLASYHTSPIMFPVSHHTEFSKTYNWTNAEDMLTEISRTLVFAGLAEYDRKNRAATLVEGVTWDMLADGLGVEKRWLTGS